MVRVRVRQQGGHDSDGYLRVLKTVAADAVAQYKLPSIRHPASVRSGTWEEELESDDPVNMFTVEEMGNFMEALRVRWPQWYTMLYLQFAMRAGSPRSVHCGG